MNAPPRTVPRAGPVLALLCTVQFILVLDNAIADVALPACPSGCCLVDEWLVGHRPVGSGA